MKGNSVLAGRLLFGLRSNLYMRLSALPQFTRFNVTKRNLEERCEWFWGKDIAERSMPPAEQTLVHRNAWRETHNEGSRRVHPAGFSGKCLFWMGRGQRPQGRIRNASGLQTLEPKRPSHFCMIFLTCALLGHQVTPQESSVEVGGLPSQTRVHLHKFWALPTETMELRPFKKEQQNESALPLLRLWPYTGSRML